MTALSAWSDFLGMESSEHWLLTLTLALSVVFLAAVMPALYLFVYGQRKWVADLQARVGPNRAGSTGILFPAAQAAMNLLKRDAPSSIGVTPLLWFYFRNAILLSSLALIPVGGTLTLVNTDLSAFLVIWLLVTTNFCTFMIGISQPGGLGLLGGCREMAQMLSGLVPSVLCLLLLSGYAPGLSWSQMASAQGIWPYQWLMFKNPFLFVAFPVFLVSGMIILEVHPFGPSKAVQASLSGRPLLLTRVSRIYGYFLWCVVTGALFLGSWQMPTWLDGHPSLFSYAQFLLVFGKGLVLMVVSALVASVLPGWRSDQSVEFSWKVLAPLAFLSFLGATLLHAWRGQ